MGFFSTILDLLFPPKCAFCSKVLNKGDDGCCDLCIEALPYTDDLGKQEGEFFDFCISPLYYKGDVRKSLLKYKFRSATANAYPYGKLLADCIRGCPDIGYDLISWVPLSNKRKRSRGYDQAFLLALATALELEDVAVETLKKQIDAKAQSDLGDREERAANISGAYMVPDQEMIEGKCVLLIDDVVTSCATLDECAKVLLAAGAKRVVCAALARGE